MKRIAHRLVPKATHAALLHAGMLAAGSAMAVPGLQLNFTGGIYDPAPSETVVFSGASATLNAYLLASTRNTLDDTYYLAIALTPQISTPSNLGSFTIEGTTVNVTADMVFGTPPAETLGGDAGHDGGDLGQHGIYDTYYYEYEIHFDGLQMSTSVDVEADPGFDPSANPGSDLHYLAFNIDASLLDPAVGLHFDLYNTKVKSATDIDVDNFAPFSHDAELIRGGGGNDDELVTPQAIPTPGTLLLLGTPMIGIGACRRRRA